MVFTFSPIFPQSFSTLPLRFSHRQPSQKFEFFLLCEALGRRKRPLIAGYLGYAINAIRLHPNSATAGYLRICVYKNPAIVSLAIAGFFSIGLVNNRTMLLVWNSLLVPRQQAQLRTIDPLVCFWPRSWQHSSIVNYAVPGEWWISFSHTRYGLVWILHYPDHSRVIYRD